MVLHNNILFLGFVRGFSDVKTLSILPRMSHFSQHIYIHSS
ncbi:hypothetical protein F383_11662 [Gossypium arboreum]|uniref:Uncharacterized protein n=1 Tax=Gossypium arboreum TaxID=29729 RepID=A0A0B0MFG6_GOSAR|nr:hypothetical protein F383_36971 [Gossypium arboreum]KHG11421.1 hypothetical protein F383_11662 [Gossypium arboreum]